ncbi:hypothetical protein OEV98_14840 [Caldibacillus lycopersici]|uniref:Uncharacterized protein n=1 Tax=Perspicuibacillus lycopersici TaxID=1325689 RepID=A0AAE3LTZ9_9BACI|nr:hypothetical protein [Perspicuibacillus lycopersici]MCU9614818.1 hypothetical protein [Perspicuibacillus lycopersici]
MEQKIKTYEEAINFIEEIGLLPLAPLVPDFPSLNSITSTEHWYTDTEFDPWMWRTKFSADGVAGYGKFLKKKSVLISRRLLPYVKKVLGHSESMEERYYNGVVSKDAFTVYEIIKNEAGIDTRALREKAGLKEKENKKRFDNALLELQGTMDIVISGIQVKTNAEGEKNGWSSTSFETYESWEKRNKVEAPEINEEEAKSYLKAHFLKVASNESIKKIEKILSL